MNKGKTASLLMLLMSIVLCLNVILFLSTSLVFYWIFVLDVVNVVLLVLSILSVIFSACNMNRVKVGFKNSIVVFSFISLGLIFICYIILFSAYWWHWSIFSWIVLILFKIPLIIIQVVLMIIALVLYGQSNVSIQPMSGVNYVPVDNQSNVNIQQVRQGLPAQVTFSPAEELKKFKELVDMGVITQEEFDKKKKDLLGL